MSSEKKRWQYRFDNFSRPYFLLREAVERDKAGELDQLAKEGMIKRFELCIELAWKTMKDYLESQNMVFGQVTPRAVLKESIAGNLVSGGEGWMSALDAHNKLSRTYDFKKFEAVIEQIHARYLDCIGGLYEKLSEAYMEINDG
ncbi:MAG: nucleotidyltransferase substrate binding protein [Candidatus Dadabacteria bacterium]|nr:nucleotidyltransferase substrate binding protein [Candidatus Dadabacteria bacterium]